jgi:hypothetical protein
MSDQWYVARRGQDGSKRYGPVPLAELRGLVDAGRVLPDDLVWRQGMANWQRAGQCDDLFPPGPRRGPRDDRPYDDRRYGDDRSDRGPRRYGPYGDRPYYRRPYSQPSSAAWAVPLAVVGGVLFCFLACGGIGAFSMLMSRPSYTTPVYSNPYGPQTPADWEEKQDDPPAFPDPNAWQPPPPPAFVPPDPNPPIFVPPDPNPPVFVPPDPPGFVPPPRP